MLQKLLFILLYPFSIIYDTVTRLRNHLYNIGSRPSVSFDLPVICVGNLTVGGTGKTPHIEWLIRLLKNKQNIATLSRGYGRKTSGFILADNEATSQQIGDEPMQFFNKFRSEVTVAVGEERALAIPTIVQERPKTEVILLDDAFQHRKVRPSFNILLTDFNRPFYKDFLLPAGRLREARKGADRANMIIVSKCPQDLGAMEQEKIIASIQPYSKAGTPVFFSSIRYAQPTALGEEKVLEMGKPVILVTGIAQTGPLKEYVGANFQLKSHLSYPDHADYSPSRIAEIKSELDKYPDAAILTTEKDGVKLMGNRLIQQLPMFEIKIEIYFLNNQHEAEKLILNHINSF